MANLKFGSTGDEVKKLQEKLGFTGEKLGIAAHAVCTMVQRA